MKRKDQNQFEIELTKEERNSIFNHELFDEEYLIYDDGNKIMVGYYELPILENILDDLNISKKFKNTDQCWLCI